MNDNEGKIILKIKYFDEIKIEMNESDKIKDIINKYCEEKNIINSQGFYLTDTSLKKLDDNLTIKEAKLTNNQTLYITKDNLDGY
jgi:hypothetical protein